MGCNPKQTEKKEPMVSIVVPVYNGSNYMREAIDSALAQTYKNIEVIVVNDGSNDSGATRNIALSYGDHIRYFEKENGGVSSALNMGIRNMRGDYFSWLSHDDMYTPKKIERQVAVLSKMGAQNCIAMCSLQMINQNAERIWTKKKHRCKTITKVSWDTALDWLIRDGSFGGCNLMIPKSAFERCGLFDESMRYLQDFLMWMKIFFAHYGLICDNDVGVYNRIHDKQLTQSGRELFHAESIRMGEIVIPQLSEHDNGKKYLLSYALYNAKNGNRSVAQSCVEEGERRQQLTLRDKILIRMYVLYGIVRPQIRKIYYRLFRGIKTV